MIFEDRVKFLCFGTYINFNFIFVLINTPHNHFLKAVVLIDEARF